MGQFYFGVCNAKWVRFRLALTESHPEPTELLSRYSAGLEPVHAQLLGGLLVENALTHFQEESERALEMCRSAVKSKPQA